MTLLDRAAATVPEDGPGGVTPDPDARQDAGSGSGRSKRPRRSGPRRQASPAPIAVNLLSPGFLEELRVRRLRTRFLLAALTMMVVVAGSWGVLRMTLARGQQDLVDDRSVATGLASQLGDLAPVRTYSDAVGRRATSIEDTLAGDVDVSRVLRALSAALPPGAQIDGITATLPTAVATDPTAPVVPPTCPGPDPFGAVEVAGCLQLSGTARTRADVATLVRTLGTGDLFVEPFIATTTTASSTTGTTGTTGTTDTAGGVSFSGSVGLTSTARSGRYADVDGSDEAADDQAAGDRAAGDRAAGDDRTPAPTDEPGATR